MPPLKTSSESVDQEDQPPGKRLLNSRPFFVAADPLAFYPQLFENHLSFDLQKYYRSNGHFQLLQNLHLQVESQLDQCQSLWQQFTPSQTLFDTWEFRYAFWQGYRHQPYFLTLKHQENNLALLPLWYEADRRKYLWFGSSWQEENRFLATDPLLAPLLLSVAPQPLHLNAISADMVTAHNQFFDFTADDPKYILDLTQINSLDDFLARFRKKRRYNLRRDKRLIESQQPQIIINRFDHFDHLVALSNQRFHQMGEDTDWEDPRRVATFKHVIKLGQKKLSYRLRMITVKIGGQIAGVDLIALFNRCYYPLKCGYHVSRFPGIGNYFNLIEIQDALSLGMKKMDFLEINYGWKDKWFQAVPLYLYEK